VDLGSFRSWSPEIIIFDLIPAFKSGYLWDMMRVNGDALALGMSLQAIEVLLTYGEVGLIEKTLRIRSFTS
jgi:hypothetical protein